MNQIESSSISVADQGNTARMENDPRNVHARLRGYGDGREQLYVYFAQRINPSLSLEQINEAYNRRATQGFQTGVIHTLTLKRVGEAFLVVVASAGIAGILTYGGGFNLSTQIIGSIGAVSLFAAATVLGKAK